MHSPWCFRRIHGAERLRELVTLTDAPCPRVYSRNEALIFGSAFLATRVPIRTFATLRLCNTLQTSLVSLSIVTTARHIYFLLSNRTTSRLQHGGVRAAFG